MTMQSSHVEPKPIIAPKTLLLPLNLKSTGVAQTPSNWNAAYLSEGKNVAAVVLDLNATTQVITPTHTPPELAENTP